METFKEKKLSTKRKALPQIRQTRTSAYRILKANPLMLHDQESIKKMGLQDLNNIPKSVDILGISLRKGDSKTSSTCTVNISKTQPQINNEIYVNNNNNIQSKLKPKTINTFTTINNRNICTIKNKNISSFNKSAFLSVKNPGRPSSISTVCRGQVKHIKRRSKSEDKSVGKSMFGEIASKLEISRSMVDIQKESIMDINISSACEKQQNIIFKTPTAYNRRSVASCTPSSGWKSYKSHSNTPAPSDLQKRLNEWLAKRGKSIGSFHHLMCFGLNKGTIDLSKEVKQSDENKENIEVAVTLDNDGSYENLETCDTFELNSEVTEKLNFELIARDALDDLNKLIQDGYPSDQCEAWLSRIQQKYQQLEDEPLYWECRAGLEQCRGNISSAVEHYRKAIVKGAEVQIIEESLDHLLHKFSLLHINPDLANDDMKSRRIILDARNAFKSTIIRFAVQERTLKKKENDAKNSVFVTPVRRSARLSVAPQSRTSGVKLCASLKEVELNENTKFKTNNYLSIRFTPK